MIPIYVINLQRSVERRNFISKQLNKSEVEYKFIDAVDAMNTPNIEEHALKKATLNLNNLEMPLPRGHIACVLSHIKAYEEIINQNHEFALIIEDDVLVSNGIKTILNSVQPYLEDDKVVFLYTRFFNSVEFVTITSLVDSYSLCESASEKSLLRGTQAYIISKKLAQKLAQNLYPVKGVIDDWELYKDKGYISNFRIIFPFPVLHGEFLSDLREEKFGDLKSLKDKFKHIVYKYKLPPFYNFFLNVRRRRVEVDQKKNLRINGERVKKTFKL